MELAEHVVRSKANLGAFDNREFSDINFIS